MDKMFDLILKSKIFRVSFLVILATLFFVFGLFQISDYFAGEHIELTRSFPLSIGLSGVLFYFTVWAYRDHGREKK